MKLSLRKTILLIILALILVIALGLGILKIIDMNKKDTEGTEDTPSVSEEEESDPIKFKKEWEAVNGTVDASSGVTYNEVNIPEDNPIKYISIEELLNIIDNEDAYIYIGEQSCIYCRQTIETLLKVAKDLNIETLYYFGLGQSKYSVSDNDYEGMMQKLVDKGLVTRKEDNRISWRIPILLKTRGGEIISKVQSMSISYEEGQTKYDRLTDEQCQVVYNKYYEELSK